MSEKNCRSCGQPWVEHHGIQTTCRQLQECRSALALIETWAKSPEFLSLDSVKRKRRRGWIIGLCAAANK